MNVPLHRAWTQDQFFAWAAGQEAPHEFDGFQPVAMTGGTAAHAVVTRNLGFALRARLRGSPCDSLGPDAGVETVNKAIRYPDALVTCTAYNLAAQAIPGVVAVFEVVSASSSRRDRITKVREYAGVASIRRYVILESTSIGLTVLERSAPDQAWRTTVLTGGDILAMPEIGIEIPVGDIYEGLAFSDQNEFGEAGSS